MSRLKIGHGEWVVVCDGRKALILQMRATRFRQSKDMENREHKDERHAQGTHSPGRVHSVRRAVGHDQNDCPISN